MIQRTNKSVIVEEFRGAKGSDILIQRTNKSLIIEELRGSKGSDFDTAHEQKLFYRLIFIRFP